MTERNDRILGDIKPFSSHNTPPDVVVTDGSVIIESEEELDDAGGFKYIPKTNPTENPEITHIRILVDNGDKVYEDLEAIGSQVIIDAQQNGSAADREALTIKKDGDSFTIKSKKQLGKKNAPNKPRKHKLLHSEGENFRIASVKVVKPSGFSVTFEAPSQKFESAEFRVLVWLH